MDTLKTDETVMTEADNALNRIFDTVEWLESGRFSDALRYVSIIENGIAQIKKSAIIDAVIGGESATTMAEALQLSRQTFYNRHALDMKEAKKKESEDLMSFAEKKTVERFQDGKITKGTELREVYDEPLDDEQEAYYHSFLDAMEKALLEGSSEWHGLVEKALKSHIIPADRVITAVRQAKAYENKEYLTDDFGEPKCFTDEGNTFYRMQAIDELNHKPERHAQLIAALKAMMEAEAKWEESERAKQGHVADPFAGFGLPAHPAAAKLPDNLIEVWEKYQADAKAAGRKPTRDAFAKQYGVSRSTFSRALKKAEAEQNEQEA